MSFARHLLSFKLNIPLTFSLRAANPIKVINSANANPSAHQPMHTQVGGIRLLFLVFAVFNR